MISHSKKFIFVHIDKTGGTSIKRTMAKQLKTRFIGPQHEHIIDLLKKRNGRVTLNLEIKYENFSYRP